MKSHLIACIGVLLVLGAGTACAAPQTPSGGATKAQCPPGTTCGFKRPTHGHHAKVKPGQKNEDGLSNNWPGPHPGIGGGDRSQMGMSGAHALPSSGQRVGQQLGQ